MSGLDLDEKPRVKECCRCIMESCQDYYNNEKSLEGCIAFVYLCQIVHVFVNLLLIYATSQFYQNLSPLVTIWSLVYGKSLTSPWLGY